MTYAITMVTFNSDTFLRDAVEHCWNLTAPPSAVIIVDNGSSDSTLEIVKAQQIEHPSLVLLRNHTNMGFAHGQNQAIRLARRKKIDAVLLLNPDVLLEPNYPGALLRCLGRHPQAGSGMGKLLRLERGSTALTAVIDSTGINLRKSLTAVDRGAGETDRGQYEMEEEVFGGSGAATMYRIAALEDVAVETNVFEESFGSYKEDVDLSWRLRWRGWQHWYDPDAVADHYRFHRGGTLRQILRQRGERTMTTRRLSLVNQYRVVLRNVPGSIIARYALWILIREVAKLAYCMVREPSTLLGIGDVIAALTQLLRQRRMIRQRAVVQSSFFLPWFRSPVHSV